MNLLPQTATARISLAIGLSFLLHSVVMFSPLIELPRTEVPLPPLTARLEPLPKIAIKPGKPKPSPKSTETRPRPSDASTQEEQVAEAVQEAPQIDAKPPAEETPPEVPSPHPLLPRRAQLTFNAYQGEGGLQIGTATHRLDIEQGHYILKTVTQTTGIASLFKSYLLTQTSRGEADAQGLRPLVYREDKKLSGGTQNLSAEFDWTGRKLRFSHGGEAALPEHGQDIVSFLYQLSQLPLDKSVVPLSISNGKKLERYELEVGEEEYLQTHLGNLRALPLRKIHGAGEEGLDIWLGLEYRLLPVKIRQIDRNGKTAGEMVISEILVSDE
ncbi:MAG TPA: DUF3108 domain-containing protein [Gallionella sp.]|nr:DUF3108 domain-containing protein [Gallionella sp.]